LLLSVIVYCIDQFWLLYCRLSGHESPPKHIVLYYHAVASEQRERFARQLDEILRSAIPFSFDKKYPYSHPGHYVAMTFDDGYASFLHNALPELAKRNLPFIIFVPSGHIGQYPVWIKDEVQRAKLGRIMDEVELRELSTLEIAAIGSHCITHRNLLRLTDDEARDEIFRSKSDLERILAKKVANLSFPHGGFHEAHIVHAKASGYERIFSIDPSLHVADEYVIGRIHCDPDDGAMEFRLKMLGAYRWMCSASLMKTRIMELIQSKA
jgi:peptidoglycan/xylan/chitin deacetylase (PgdA/CDA1 family)